ncbi:SMP-30/gluconolactonase/LRE family protein [Temperatibacter marinus]|uniref:SMP-30/gluconolactonase/LRE family protein n=1 Tax=Temperatibacter marinus TaxID=1456591 RepID=A0AA52EH64_9PROT|nr:SMP-30/gluconolactonase/LRE family protein [Temperatibacter marinus]WND02710.1 SMP-30/gluconolactonase/LRE family protein [Temperatibacter marinus]
MARFVFLIIVFFSPSISAQDRIIQFDPALNEVIDTEASIMTLSKGHRWLEGPAWDKKRQKLYFSDVPENRSYQWSTTEGVTPFLDPSGIDPRQAAGFREPGTNGLYYLGGDRLMMANHGLRRVEILNLKTLERSAVVETYKGKKFNSPNDIIPTQSGGLYFTDPPYGLEGVLTSPLREIDFSGVYYHGNNGQTSVIDKDLSFPNGVALSPDQKMLYVAVSDPNTPHLYGYRLSEEGKVQEKKLLFDMKSYLESGLKGMPDGMTIATSGHIFLTGPGGVFILSPEGKPLGQIRLESLSANCAFGEDGQTLFIAAQGRLLKVQTKVKGW